MSLGMFKHICNKFSSNGYLCDELRVRGGNVSNGANCKHPFMLTVFIKTCLEVITRVLAHI